MYNFSTPLDVYQALSWIIFAIKNRLRKKNPCDCKENRSKTWKYLLLFHTDILLVFGLKSLSYVFILVYTQSSDYLYRIHHVQYSHLPFFYSKIISQIELSFKDMDNTLHFLIKKKNMQYFSQSPFHPPLCRKLKLLLCAHRHSASPWP